MNILNKMERKMGKFAIPHLTKWIVGTYLVGYLIYYLFPQILGYLILEPYLILRGQVWRIISWVLIPPSTSNIFFTIIMLFFYYSIGSALEQTWGNFRFNFYIFSGLILTVIGAFILYAVTGAIGIGLFISTYYISMAIFLAFAATYPNMQVMLYFLIPIKVKWLAIVDVVILAYDFIKLPYWPVRVAMIASVVNFVLFFLLSRNYKSSGTAYRQRTFKTKEKPRREQSEYAPGAGITKHKCAICGRTENDGIDLEFRFCTKCNGNYEYCQEHLFTHMHK